ncbi:Dedicator of cytokinesis protein 3 [Mactra antiquata]
MEKAMWIISKKKYGVAICNYNGGAVSEALNLQVGETVHIFEEYGTGPSAWYRGRSLKNQEKMGVFPACFIHVKQCDVHNEGLYETITPKEDVVVKEVSDVLYEWNIIWKELYVKNKPLFSRIKGNMEELIHLRSLLVDLKLTEEDARDVKSDIVSVIDWGNGKLDMDLVPRVDGEQLDADLCSLTQLHRVHLNSSKIAEQDEPQRKRTKTSKTELAMQAGLHTHHLLVSFRNFGCHVGDHTETLLALYVQKDSKIICISEKFLVRHNAQMVPEDIMKLEHYYGLFMDLGSDEIEKDIYLVAHIYRIGNMKTSDHSTKKLSKVLFKRPWGVGVTSLSMSRLPANFKEWEFQMKVYCPNSEKDFTHIHKDIINGRMSSSSSVFNSNKQNLSLTIAVQVFHGDLATVKKEEPILFSKGVAQIQKYGFTEVISPGEVRNDLYVTLKTCDLERGSKTTQKNVEIRVAVMSENGKVLENCISYGCGEPATAEYVSAIYYHNNKPDWNETVKISVPIDVFPGCHVCFELYHCSVSNGKQKRVPYGFAYMKVTNDAQIVIKDDEHDLCVYQLDEKRQKDLTAFFKYPFLLDDLNDPRMMPKVNKQMFRNNEREYLKISTLLCSGKFTQNGDLLGILNWKGKEFTGKIEENLEKLCVMQGEEIVKFLHDIMDGLFDMLTEDSLHKHHSDKIFKAMINIFTLLHHARFEMFKPVLENYITDTFSATLVHKPLCECFAEMISSVTNDGGHKTNTQLLQSFRDMDYIFRFIVQSRMLQRKDVYTRGSDDANEFRENVHKIFENMGVLLSSKSDRHKAYQVELLGHLHLIYSPLMTVMSDKDVADLLTMCLELMPDITKKMPEDIIRVKIELLRKTVDTHLFQSDASRSLLLPLCLNEIKQSIAEKKLVNISMELLSDIMDCVFKLKKNFESTCLVDVGTISIKEDIQHIIRTLFDVVMDTIISVDHRSKWESDERTLHEKQRKKPTRSITHSGFTMKEMNLQLPGTISPKRKLSPKVISRKLSTVIIPDKTELLSTATSRKISDPGQYKGVTTLSLLDWMKAKAIREMEVTTPSEKTSSEDMSSSIVTDESTTRGSMIACLMEMLRLMDDEHYDSLLHVYHRGKHLRKFLINILEVFNVLVQPKIFPSDWSVLRMVTNNIIFTSVSYFSDAMRNNFMVGDKFDLEIWKNYFGFAVAFITQPSLQLDRYTDVKARKFKERYQDMRVLMGVQVESLWHALGGHKSYFIPELVGPFLELTLVPEEEVRKVTLPIIFDMMECNQKRHGHFKQVEAELMERLDYFLTQRHGGDVEYKDLFKNILLERVQSEPSLQENGPQFIISVTHLLERLLDYRQVVDGEENRDKRMHCTFNILNFYKDEINREEMYIRYVNKLHDLHMVANNHAEAGLTLQLYAKVLGWSDNTLPEEMKYKQERERDRKEMLYTQIINCFDKGKVWEYALPLCKDLAEYYERNLDYKKLSDVLKQQATFYQKILEGEPDGDATQTNLFYPRQDPSYYAVAYYGKSFPAFVRNKQFIYRGDECLKLPTIMNHLTAEFPNAQFTSFSTQSDHLKDGEQQYIQVCSVKSVPGKRLEFNGKDVSLEIQNFYKHNEVDTFRYDKPYHREKKDPNNEAKTICYERLKMKTSYKFPGILRWYEVTEVEVEMLCPIRVAIDMIQQNIYELPLIISRCQMNHKLFFSQLEMKLSGIISAHVGGGISKYQEAFFTEEFKTKYPDEAVYVDTLKALLVEQIGFLSRGMSLHKKLVTDDLVPLHNNLEKEFKIMKKSVSEYGSPYNSTVNVGGNVTPGSCSSRSSTISQEEDSGVIHPDGIPFNLAVPDKSRRSYVPFPEEGLCCNGNPPPIPTRPQSMLLSPQGSQGAVFKQSRTGSDPALPTGGLSHIRVTTNAATRAHSPHGKPVDRTKTMYNPRETPMIPQRRKFSEKATNNVDTSPEVPTISTNGLGTILDSEGSRAPEVPEKKKERPKMIFSNGSPSGLGSSVGHGSAPLLQRGISNTSITGLDVPPLPPRKNTSSAISGSRSDNDFNNRPNRQSTNRFSNSSQNSLSSPPTPGATTPSLGGPPPIPRRSETKRGSSISNTSTNSTASHESTDF